MIVDAGVKSDMRGLVTAGRTVLLERIACLASSVIMLQATGFAHRAFAGRSQALPPSGLGSDSCGVQSLSVEDGQRPAPAGQLARDRGVGDHGPLVTGIETAPPGVQAPVGLVSSGSRRRARGAPTAT